MSNTIQEHPQLKRPLVKEALLELRYSPSPDLPYGFVPGRLYESLKSTFPSLLELPGAEIPFDIAPKHLVRHRFLTQDGTRMFQVGLGVLSVNHVAYTGFSNFLQDCQKVLQAAFSIELFSVLDRIGLRYINKTPLDRELDQITQIVVNAPLFLQSNMQGQVIRLITGLSGLGTLSTAIAWPEKDDSEKTSLVLDLDLFNKLKRELTEQEVLEWVTQAHDAIYEAFKNSLQAEYFANLQGG